MAVAIIYSSGRTGRAAHAIPRTSLPLGLDTNMKEYFIANGFKIGKKGAKVRSFVRSFVRPGGRADGRRGRRQAAPMLHVEFMKSLLKRKGKFPNKPKRAEAAAAATTTQSVDDRKKLSSTDVSDKMFIGRAAFFIWEIFHKTDRLFTAEYEGL